MQSNPNTDIEKWLFSIFADAIKVKASDIHIIPESTKIIIKFRIDGKIVDYRSMNINNLTLLTGKLKIIGNLQIEESRLPQDGSFTIDLNGREIYMRMSTLPTLFGEKVVLRILDSGDENIPLESLGFNKIHEKKMEKHIKRKKGLILIVGPTGSGKSTTILSVIKQFNPKQHNISTLEDPVEYRINGVTHSQINHKIGFNFATGLRSLLRQDPDIIMVGEIRDKETAKLAMEAAITGHLVLSTLHANSSTNSVQRLISLDIDPNMITSGLKLVVSQQLIRRLCPKCKEEYIPTTETINEINKIMGDSEYIKGEINLYRKSKDGCEYCNHSGFKGRIGIFEIFELTKSIKKLILDRQPENYIEEQAEKDGMILLKQDGILKVLDGEISFAELCDSTGEV